MKDFVAHTFVELSNLLLLGRVTRNLILFSDVVSLEVVADRPVDIY